MGKKIVYLVTEGTHSDYGVLAIFSKKKLAEEFIERYSPYSYDDVRVEEYKLDVQRSRWEWIFVRMDKEGKVLETERKMSIKKMTPNPSRPEFDGHGNLILYVQTDSLEKAIKVANEVRARLIADDKFPVVKR